ncbi:hypothetical protein MSAS_10920 [Mycobacterium saskatchewanense]|uniref:Uncharacterized protein n=1 Tax=Mycobacterium saskatchewanense TaxID=220927 RepID=A0AAJ3NTZ0_9MYCO|nr:hypothetical protein [Mycobacterium saskatchewanense]ORW74442.1 hypothetical protein AWC23_05105 [Mycobacterium saskatchewanense]BBX61918.1 hypothetical protein MSAS_10920 [Mycobacterium saskatchewanense]
MSCNDTETTTRTAAATENLTNLEKSLVRHRGALTDRDEYAASLRPARELLDGQLNDFPRARRLLHAAKDALDAESPGAPE